MLKIKAKKIPHKVISLSLIVTSLFVFASLAKADKMTSDSYEIQFGNFNVTSGEKSSSSYNVTDTVGQTFAGPFGSYGSSNYFVGAGFQYIYQINEFSFSVSETAVDLGELTSGVHSTASHNLEITTPGASGYSVYAYELNPLRHSNGSDEIADTTCDASDCDETTASVWSNQSITGFGFNISGDNVASDFVDSTYFRQFADNGGGESMQAIMSSSSVAENETATVTYKVGIDGTQASGNYQTGIVYVAVPGY